MLFKKGDKLRCITGSRYDTTTLATGDIVTVEKDQRGTGSSVSIIKEGQRPRAWFANRFVLAEPDKGPW